MSDPTLGATHAESVVGERPLLRRGSTGSAVRDLQGLLVRHGFDPGPIDGDFGHLTDAAVRAFQRSKALDDDGIVGPRTWAALLAPAAPGLGEAGLRLIKAFEGFVSTLYDDPAGHCTIGYGHLVHHGGCDGSEPEEFRHGISEARAAQILDDDTSDSCGTVRDSVGVALNQAQFDALVSFTFNVGGGAFQRSTLLRLLNEGDYGSVPAQLNRWVYAGEEIIPGLVRRRRAEGILFQEGRVVIDGARSNEPRTPRPTDPPDGP